MSSKQQLLQLASQKLHQIHSRASSRSLSSPCHSRLPSSFSGLSASLLSSSSSASLLSSSSSSSSSTSLSSFSVPSSSSFRHANVESERKEKKEEEEEDTIPLWPCSCADSPISIGSVHAQEGLTSWTTHPDLNIFRQVELKQERFLCSQHEWCQYLHLQPIRCSKCTAELDLHCVYDLESCSVFDPVFACQLPWVCLLLGSDFIYPNTIGGAPLLSSSLSSQSYPTYLSLTGTDHRSLLIQDETGKRYTSWDFLFPPSSSSSSSNSSSSSSSSSLSSTSLVRYAHFHLRPLSSLSSSSSSASLLSSSSSSSSSSISSRSALLSSTRTPSSQGLIVHIIIHACGLIWVQRWYPDGTRHSYEFFKMEINEEEVSPENSLTSSDGLIMFYRHGPCMTWHSNGQISSYFHYKYGKPVGRCIRWKDNGLYSYYTLFPLDHERKKHPIRFMASVFEYESELDQIAKLLPEDPYEDELEVTTETVDDGRTILQNNDLGYLYWIHYSIENEITDIWRWKYDLSNNVAVQMIRFFPRIAKPLEVKSFIYDKTDESSSSASHHPVNGNGTLLDRFITCPFGCFREWDLTTGKLAQVNQYFGESTPYRAYFARDPVDKHLKIFFDS